MYYFTESFTNIWINVLNTNINNLTSGTAAVMQEQL